MNKNDALKQIEELKSKLAELESTVNEPEYKPEDLVGKLCYVWDSAKNLNRISLIREYLPNKNRPFIVVSDVGWEHAEPVPEEEILKMIYKAKKESQYGPWYNLVFPAYAQKPTRYDWSKVPDRAKFIYTDSNGDIFWSNKKAIARNAIEAWVFHYTSNTEWHYISQGNDPCPDWKDSEEARPEWME